MLLPDNKFIRLFAPPIVSQMLLQMVSIGEQSGALDDMLEKVAIHYENEVDNAVDNCTAAWNPLS